MMENIKRISAEKVELAVSSDLVARMRDLIGLNDVESLVRVALNMGVRFLEKIAAANVSVEAESPDSKNVEKTVYRRAKDLALGKATEPLPFTKNELVGMFKRFNIYGVKPLKSNEADEFWDYLVMRGFKTAGGVPINLSNVGLTLNHWRQYNESRERILAKSKAQETGEETEEEKFERIKRNLRDIPED